jgi:hypothetical protein
VPCSTFTSEYPTHIRSCRYRFFENSNDLQRPTKFLKSTLRLSRRQAFAEENEAKEPVVARV